jgi:hypothetical protein
MFWSRNLKENDYFEVLGADGSIILESTLKKREHAVAQLVEALRYKPEGRVFDSRW